MIIHRTKQGEDIRKIASEYGISPQKLAEQNGLGVHDTLPAGRELLVIIPHRTYNVRRGDTAERIACRFGVSETVLMRQNPEMPEDKRLYSGQLLTVTDGGGTYGMISTNGYFYRGCREDRLAAMMPYLTYVTVCSAVYKDGGVHTMLDHTEAVRLARAHKKGVLLRLYMAELPKEDAVGELCDCLTILAKTNGFDGITISPLSSLTRDSREAECLMLELRKNMMENDLLLFAEGDISADCSYTEYADAAILTYDKLHLPDIPSFDGGERAMMCRFAELHESSRSFIELSSFALSGERYIEKREAMRICDRRRGEIMHDDEKKIASVTYGRGRRHSILYENLENTRAKLELLGEYCYLGVSFDIGRITVPDLLMTSHLYSIVEMPFIPKKNERRLDCRGKERTD